MGNSSSKELIAKGTKRPKGEKIDSGPCSANAKPIIIYSYRKVREGGMDHYHTVAKDWADYCRETVPGFKTNTYCEHPDGDNWVADVQWFNSIAVFRQHMFMTDPKGMKKMIKFLDGTDQKVHFTGYGFGDWNKSVFMGINLPRMFSMMPPAKWFEMRKDVGGFIRGTKAPSSDPPIFLFVDFHVKPDLKSVFIEKFQNVADEQQDNLGVYAMHLTQEDLKVKLVDKAKSREPNKLVAMFCFEDLNAFLVTCQGMEGIDKMLEKPPKIDIWANNDNTTVKGIISEAFGDDGDYKCFTSLEHGWSNHCQTCGPCEELVMPEDKETAYGKLDDTVEEVMIEV